MTDKLSLEERAELMKPVRFTPVTHITEESMGALKAFLWFHTEEIMRGTNGFEDLRELYFQLVGADAAKDFAYQSYTPADYRMGLNQ